MEAISVKSKIQLMQTPVIVDMGEWVCQNIGLIAAGKRIPDSQNVQLLAIEKAEIASPRMVKYAKENNAIILTSISEGEVNAID